MRKWTPQIRLGVGSGIPKLAFGPLELDFRDPKLGPGPPKIDLWDPKLGFGPLEPDFRDPKLGLGAQTSCGGAPN